MLRSVRLAFPLVLLAAALAAGCAARPAFRPAPAPTAGGSGSPGSAAVVGVELAEFTITPRTITVRAGVVRFRITNQGGIDHDFQIPQVEAHHGHAQHLLGPGESRTLEYRLSPGTYEVVCTVPGHREAGMNAVLDVDS